VAVPTTYKRRRKGVTCRGGVCTHISGGHCGRRQKRLKDLMKEIAGVAGKAFGMCLGIVTRMFFYCVQMKHGRSGKDGSRWVAARHHVQRQFLPQQNSGLRQQKNRRRLRNRGARFNNADHTPVRSSSRSTGFGTAGGRSEGGDGGCGGGI